VVYNTSSDIQHNLFILLLIHFQVTYNPDISGNTYSDTLEWAVEGPGLIKCFANNSEGNSSETLSLFVTGKLCFCQNSQ
jgi:hypothetical protein